MDTKWLLSRFDGRINRARYWLAALIILGSMVVALMLLAVFCLILGIPTGPLTINLVGIAASFQLDDSDTGALLPKLVAVLMTLVFAWFFAIASIKRLHDRDKPGWWIVPFIIAPGLHAQFGDWLRGSGLEFLVGLAVLIASVWGFVEMSGLKGTNGPNRFGPDPLAPIDARPRWDQHSGLEFLSHKAGPSAGATSVPGET